MKTTATTTVTNQYDLLQSVSLETLGKFVIFTLEVITPDGEKKKKLLYLENRNLNTDFLTLKVLEVNATDELTRGMKFRGFVKRALNSENAFKVSPTN